LSGGNKTEKGKQGLSPWCIVEVERCLFHYVEGFLLIILQGDYMRVERSNEIFYNYLPEEKANYWTSQLQYHATSAFYSPQEYSAFKFIPSTYIVCKLENAVPAAFQEMMATQPGADIVIERLKASHSPFMSMPDETSNIIRKAAGEF